MEPQETLLFTLATAFVIAFVFGYIASKLKLPVLVGYLLAGIAIGPFAPGVHADSEIASQLAEIGVILLMFGVGLHFSTADLMAVKWIAIPGAVGQIAVATAIGTFVAMSWGWSMASGLVLGLALSVASTVVVLRALEERSALESANGRIAIAWLVVEDLAMVLTLVLLPALAGLAGGGPGGHAGAEVQGAGALALMIAFTLLKIAVFLAIVGVAGPRVVPWILQQAARSGSHELFTLSVLAVSLGIAYGAATLFGISFALGAFCAGVVLSNTELSHRAAEESLPLQHAFAVIFFVSVGMLFDPHILTRQPLEVLSVMMIILVGKSIAAFLIVQIMGYPVTTALIVSASLAQIGEFSFILAGLGISLGIFAAEGRDLILAGALISLAINPLVFAVVTPLRNLLHGRRGLMARLAPAQDLRLARLQVTLDGNKKPGSIALPPDELVGRWSVFADLDLVMRAELLTLFKPRSAVPGERLIRKGDAANEVFFISSGAVDVSVTGKKIKLGPGDLFGEMGLLSDAPRNADVTAIDYCQLLTLDRAGFQGFVGKHPELRAKIDVIAAQRLAMNQTAPVSL
ncbi:MAG: cation:proton antiporter [Vicinamibacterales bacterium]